MKENRKVQIEVLDDGEAILSANFGEDGRPHPMKAIRVCRDYDRACNDAEALFRDASWPTETMSGDGSVPMKRSAMNWDKTPSDDIPF